MRAFHTVLIVGLLTSTTASADEAQLTKVLLSQGGVAYYEFSAKPDGKGAVQLTVPRAQVDDILKSLVVLNPKVRVDTVRLPGDAPLSVAFGRLPLDESAFQSLPDLMRALKGEAVTVTLSGGREATGRIAAVDPVMAGDTSAALTLQSSDGLSRLPLNEVQGMKIADPALDRAVSEALNAFQETRGAGMRRLDIALDGGGKGEVPLAYVAAAPLWKSTYRLTLNGDKGSLQGWAVLENYSGHDWNGVELTLSSGNPATFHQALYQAYFVDRPEVPVEMFERITPPVDEGVMAEAKAEYMASAPAARVLHRPTPAMDVGRAEVREEPTQILFKLGDNISLANGQSLTLPITEGDVAAKLVTYIQMYDQRPLAAVHVENSGKTALPPGVITIYDGSKGAVGYLGDARMGMVPVGEDRLLAFAGDPKVKADRRDQTTQSVTAAKIADGILSVTETQYYTTVVDVVLPKGEARTFVVDMPVGDNWKIVSPKSGARKIDGGYRITKSLSSGEKGSVDARFSDERSRRIALLDTDVNALSVYLKGGELSPELTNALRDVVKYKENATAAKRRLAEVDESLNAAKDEEQRARENLKAVGDSGLRQGYLDKLVAAEAKVNKQEADRKVAAESLRTAESVLRDFIRNLKIG